VLISVFLVFIEGVFCEKPFAAVGEIRSVDFIYRIIRPFYQHQGCGITEQNQIKQFGIAQVRSGYFLRVCAFFRRVVLGLMRLMGVFFLWVCLFVG
jgi:hypothetical protein